MSWEYLWRSIEGGVGHGSGMSMEQDRGHLYPKKERNEGYRSTHTNNIVEWWWEDQCTNHIVNLFLCYCPFLLSLVVTSATTGGWRLCFHLYLPVCLFVCFSMSKNIPKSYEWIWTKLGGKVGCVTRMSWFDFGEDPDPDLDLDTIIFKWFFASSCGRKRYIARYLKKLWTDSDVTWWIG